MAELFAAVAKVTGVAGMVLLIFSRPIRRLVGGAEDSTDDAAEPQAAVGGREDALPV